MTPWKAVRRPTRCAGRSDGRRQRQEGLSRVAVGVDRAPADRRPVPPGCERHGHSKRDLPERSVHGSCCDSYARLTRPSVFAAPVPAMSKDLAGTPASCRSRCGRCWPVAGPRGKQVPAELDAAGLQVVQGAPGLDTILMRLISGRARGRLFDARAAGRFLRRARRPQGDQRSTYVVRVTARVLRRPSRSRAYRTPVTCSEMLSSTSSSITTATVGTISSRPTPRPRIRSRRLPRTADQLP